MEPSPDIQFASTLDEDQRRQCDDEEKEVEEASHGETSHGGTVSTRLSSPTSPILRRGPPPPCGCSISHRLESLRESGESLNDLISVPASTIGYPDPLTGRQVGVFTTYVVQFGEITVRRRYSDFELLQRHFLRIYPFAIVPPIPPKQKLSLSSLSTLLGRPSTKEAAALIEFRIRAFHAFLGHILSNPALVGDHALHLFLSEADTGIWREEVMRWEGIELRPFGGKSPLPKSLGRPFDVLYQVLPAMAASLYSLHSTQKSLLRHYREMARVLEECGTGWNTFSLEYSPLNAPLEALGEIYDVNATSWADCVTAQQQLVEHIHETHQFIDAILRPLRNLISQVVEYEALLLRLNHLKSNHLNQNPEQESNSTDLSSVQQEADALGKTITTAKNSLQTQLVVWLRRLRTAWTFLLSQIGNVQSAFAEQGLEAWCAHADSLALISTSVALEYPAK